MIKKAIKFTLLILCFSIMLFWSYSRIEKINEKKQFISGICVLKEYREEKAEDYFNYHKIHPTFELDTIISDVNEKEGKVLYYDSFIDLIKQPNYVDCIKYYFNNKEASINDVININSKQLLDLDYDNVLAEYLYLDLEGSIIRKCVDYSKKHSEIETADVIYIVDLGLEDINPSKHFLSLIYTDFFLPARIERYIKYYEENESFSPRQVVEIVNCDADQQFYTNIVPSDLSKGLLVINNKFNYLEKDYVPENLVVVDGKYSYYGARMEKTAYDAFVEMCEAAKENLLYIIVAGDNGYRSYNHQNELYGYYEYVYGTEGADECSARAGHSEHQTGLAVDIEVIILEGNRTYSYSSRYDWVKENCWEFGFIYRYQAGKEHLTGYQEESWHYRYVGKEVALYIKEHDITFDEYYTYFVKGY